MGYSENLRVVLEAATQKALTQAAIRVQAEARRLCRVDTGTLRRSIAYTFHGSGTTMSVRVGSNVEYALMVEQGTGLYGPHHSPIVPRRGNVLVFTPRGGSKVFARSVRGRPATPFLKPALQAMRRAS